MIQKVILKITDDDKVIEAYVEIYSENGYVSVGSFENLILANYKVIKDFYPKDVDIIDVEADREIIKPIVTSCYHNKDELTSHFVVNWLTSHCKRLLRPLHQYSVFVISVAYRYFDDSSKTLNPSCLNNFVSHVPILKW